MRTLRRGGVEDSHALKIPLGNQAPAARHCALPCCWCSSVPRGINSSIPDVAARSCFDMPVAAVAQIPAWHEAQVTRLGMDPPGRAAAQHRGTRLWGVWWKQCGGGRRCSRPRARGMLLFEVILLPELEITIGSVVYWSPCLSPARIPQAWGLQPPSTTLRAAGEGGSTSAEQPLSLRAGLGSLHWAEQSSECCLQDPKARQRDAILFFFPYVRSCYRKETDRWLSVSAARQNRKESD